MTRKNTARLIRDMHSRGNAFDRMESGEQAPVTRPSSKKVKKPRRPWRRKRAATYPAVKDAD